MLYQQPCATQPELIYRREVSQLVEDVYVKYWLHDSNLPLVVIFSNAWYPTRQTSVPAWRGTWYANSFTEAGHIETLSYRFYF